MGKLNILHPFHRAEPVPPQTPTHTPAAPRPPAQARPLTQPAIRSAAQSGAPGVATPATPSRPVERRTPTLSPVATAIPASHHAATAPQAPSPRHARSPNPMQQAPGHADRFTTAAVPDNLLSAASQQRATGKGDGRPIADDVHDHMLMTTSGDIFRTATSYNEPTLKRKVEAAIGFLVNEAQNQGRRRPHVHNDPVDTGYLRQIRPLALSNLPPVATDAAGLLNVLETYGLNEHQEHIADWIRQGVAIGASDVEFRCEDGIGYMRVKWHGAMTPDIETITDPAYATKIRAAAFNLGSGTGNLGSFSEIGYQYRRIPGSVITNLPPGKMLDGIRATFMYNNTGDYDGTMQLRLFAREGDGLRSLESQGWDPDTHLPLLRKIQALPGGLVPFSGAVGHGKSTALAALLVARYVLRGQTDKLMTIQDLIEIPLRLDGKKISEDYQLPVKATGESVEQIMEELLAFVHRANPSTLMVNEAKDRSVWTGIRRCVLNGTTTFTTNHAVCALMSPYKFRDLQDDDQHIFEPELFPAFAAQRLVPVVCGHCGLSFAEAAGLQLIPDLDQIRTRLSMAFRDPVEGSIPLPPLDEILDRIRFTNPAGCQHCRPQITSSWAPYLRNHMSGTRGRTVIGEVAMTNRKIMHALRCNDMIGARKHWIDDGGSPMQRHALYKIAGGIVDPREVEKLFGDIDRFHLLTTSDDAPPAATTHRTALQLH